MIQKKTLNFLSKHLCDFSNVYIFVSKSSFNEYKILLEKYNNINLILSKDSILEARNHIIQYFEEGTAIVEMDDDVEEIEILNKNANNVCIDNFIETIHDSFDLVDYEGLFGFNANNNYFFSSCENQFGLYSIINSCCGYINDKSIILTCREKEDFERTILFYKKGKKILKRGGYGIKTKYWKNKGGIQDHYDFEKRKVVQKESAIRLLELYPNYCYKVERKNGIVDIRFKRNPSV